MKRFLCVQVNRGEEFYVKEDDSELVDENSYLEIEYIPAPLSPVKRKPKHDSHKRIRLTFSDYGLCKRVRARVYELLVPFDANKDKQFDEP